MGKTLPSLDSLRFLAACVRHGNFSRAGAELGISPTAVSQRMRALEAEIGVKLFQRHGPRLTTTDRAKALGRRIEHALSLMRGAVDDCRRARHPLRVTCAPTFAARWLVPRLATYHSLPGADAVALDDTQTVLPEGTFDVAIRSGSRPGHDAARLFTEQATPMLSPRWMPRRGRLTVQRLVTLPLIPDPQWPDWFKLAGYPRAKPSFVATRFPSYELEAQAAVQGVGAALLSPILFADLTRRAALIAPFPWVVERSDYWLLWTKESSESHFVKWMKWHFNIAPADR